MPLSLKLDVVSWERLLDKSAMPLWAIIDSVNCPEAYEKLRSFPTESICLYSSPSPETQMLAPWLARIETGSAVAKWLQGLDPKSHWGILLQATQDMATLRAHFRKYTMLWVPVNTAAPVYFRFYDPRVIADAFHALDARKYTDLCPENSRIILPLSDEVFASWQLKNGTPEEIVKPDKLWNEQLVIVPDRSGDAGPAISKPAQFRVSDEEFARFSQFQKDRSILKLARYLHGLFDNAPLKLLLTAAYQAPDHAEKFGMHTKEQVRTIAYCLVEFGLNFPEGHPDAHTILADRTITAWQKQTALGQWVSKYKLRKEFLSSGGLS